MDEINTRNGQIRCCGTELHRDEKKEGQSVIWYPGLPYVNNKHNNISVSRNFRCKISLEHGGEG